MEGSPQIQADQFRPNERSNQGSVRNRDAASRHSSLRKSPLMEGQQMRTFLKTTQRRAWWLVCLCLLLVTGSATAQTDQGAITGTVTDNTGALVPGAPVTR